MVKHTSDQLIRTYVSITFRIFGGIYNMITISYSLKETVLFSRNESFQLWGIYMEI